jgi:transcriptional regulator of acetoin/glycerol metabolism
MEAMLHYDWPGNVRQISNVVQAAMAIDYDNRQYIGIDVLAQLIQLPNIKAGTTPDLSEYDYATALARFEHDYLGRLLHLCAGNIEEVARRAGMNVATIYRKIKKFELR